MDTWEYFAQNMLDTKSWKPLPENTEEGVKFRFIDYANILKQCKNLSIVDVKNYKSELGENYTGFFKLDSKEQEEYGFLKNGELRFSQINFADEGLDDGFVTKTHIWRKDNFEIRDTYMSPAFSLQPLEHWDVPDNYSHLFEKMDEPLIHSRERNAVFKIGKHYLLEIIQYGENPTYELKIIPTKEFQKELYHNNGYNFASLIEIKKGYGNQNDWIYNLLQAQMTEEPPIDSPNFIFKVLSKIPVSNNPTFLLKFLYNQNTNDIRSKMEGRVKNKIIPTLEDAVLILAPDFQLNK